MIPQTYEAWHRCITVDCGIALTPDFVRGRLKVYENERDAETQQFIELYGRAHFRNVLRWYQQELAD